MRRRAIICCCGEPTDPPECPCFIQLGVSVTLTAPCTGRLYLAFNDNVGGLADNAGSYTVSINGSAPITVNGTDPEVDTGICVEVGDTITCSASGYCSFDGSYYVDASADWAPGSPTFLPWPQGSGPSDYASGMVLYSLVGQIKCESCPPLP